MNFEDERYVRIYVRDTVTWKLMGWQARCLLPLLLRKVDRAGCVDLDGAGAEGVAALVEIPLEVAEPGFKSLLARGVVEVRGDTLIFPKYMSAQEAKQSDKVRQQESRARKRDAVLRRLPVTDCDGESRTVTAGHETQQNVTAGHAASHDVTPYRTVLSRAQPSPEPSGSVAVGHAPPPPSVVLSGQSQPRQESQQAALIPEALASPKQAPERSGKPRKARAAKDAPETTARTNPVWEAYSAAFLQRHRTEPTRNMRVNIDLGRLIDRIGAADAPAVAAFYVRHPAAFYVGQLHPVWALLKDAEKLHAEWRRGQTASMTQARRDEQTASNPFLEELAERRRARAAAEQIECQVEGDDVSGKR